MDTPRTRTYFRRQDAHVGPVLVAVAHAAARLAHRREPPSKSLGPNRVDQAERVAGLLDHGERVAGLLLLDHAK